MCCQLNHRSIWDLDSSRVNVLTATLYLALLRNFAELCLTNSIIHIVR